MSTWGIYLRAQLATLVVGIVGPVFLVIFFTVGAEADVDGGADAGMMWMYWIGLFITAADVLIALWWTAVTVRQRADVDVARD